MSAHATRVTHVVAHRGNAGDFPENTVAALQSAFRHGVRFCLVDVQLAGDETPVLCRDVELARTTGATGSIFDYRAPELEQLEVAEHARFGARHAGTRLAQLADLAHLLRMRPEVTAFLDLQRASLARHGVETCVGRVLDAVREVRAQCVPVSSDLGAVHLARERTQGPVGWALGEYDGHARLKYEALRPDYLLVSRAALPDDASRLWRGPWRWLVTDVQAPDEAVTLAGRGADFVATAAVAAFTRELRLRAQA